MGLHPVFDNPACLILYPPLEGPIGESALDLAFTLHEEAVGLRNALPPSVASSIGDMIRIMNCYYSNLIEGHDTRPVDIENAMYDRFSRDKTRRSLQHEAKAHVMVQMNIDRGRYDGLPLSEMARHVHRDFYSRMPPELCVARKEDTGEEISIAPGGYREDHVMVGGHVPVDSKAIPGFMARFDQGYDPSSIGRHRRAIAAAAMHHRFLWVHPFLDGNGRVARLLSHAYFRMAGLGSEMWSVARGLAIHNTRYKDALARADYPPQGATDGRGTLSDGNLASFVLFFLAASLDQVRFMRELIEPNSLKRNLSSFVAAEAIHGRLDQRIIAVLHHAVTVGEVERATAHALLGVSDRQARRLLDPLIKRGLLVDPGPRLPLKLGFPLRECEAIFPRLFSVEAMHRAAEAVRKPGENWQKYLDASNEQIKQPKGIGP